MKRQSIVSFFLITITSLIVFNACHKGAAPLGQEDQTFSAQKGKPAEFSSEVLDKWMTMQLRLMRNANRNS
jgi:hypothetical protein